MAEEWAEAAITTSDELAFHVGTMSIAGADNNHLLNTVAKAMGVEGQVPNYGNVGAAAGILLWSINFCACACIGKRAKSRYNTINFVR